MDKTAAIDKIAELIKGAHLCIMTTVDEDGQLVSRPMALQNKDFDGELWFFTSDKSHKVQQIADRPEVNIAIENNNSWLSISGEAVVVDDKAKEEELWTPAMKGWFPDGTDSPDITLVKVNATGAQYWDTTSSKLVTLFAYAKASITGQPPSSGEIGESHTVDLED